MAVEREPTYFGSVGEQFYGFAQAVRAGDTVYVAGQTAMADDGSVSSPGDMAGQMAKAYEGIARALAPFGATLADVVDETVFTTDVAAAAGVALEVRTAAYGGPPAVASTLCQVAALGMPELLVEIKCTARI